MNIEKEFKIKLWRILEKYGMWQDYKHRFIKKDVRDRLFKDMIDLYKNPPHK